MEKKGYDLRYTCITVKKQNGDKSKVVIGFCFMYEYLKLQMLDNWKKKTLKCKPRKDLGFKKGRRPAGKTGVKRCPKTGRSQNRYFFDAISTFKAIHFLCVYKYERIQKRSGRVS